MKKKLVISAYIVTHLWCMNAFANSEVSDESKVELLSAYEGNPESQFKLALRYAKKISSTDSSVNDNNSKKAFYWYKQAARQGNASAQYNLGHFYYKGIGTDKDEKKTIFWWLNSANQGYIPAQHNMGLAYANGIGVEKDIRVAKQWFSLCAETEAKTGAIECAGHVEDIEGAQSKKNTADKNTDTTGITIENNTPVLAWVYKSYTSTTNNVTTLTGDKVRARLSPEIIAGNIVSELEINSEFPYISEQGKWVKIELTTTSVAARPIKQEKSEKESKPLAPLKLSKKTYKGAYSFKNKRSDDEWLFSLPENSLTLQLNSFDTQKALDSFTGTNDLKTNENYHLMLSKRHAIEWKYALYGGFTTKDSAEAAIKEQNLTYARIVNVRDIKQLRCSAWKITLPPPAQLDKYCVTKAKAAIKNASLSLSSEEALKLKASL